jgi:hypothetical protein
MVENAMKGLAVLMLLLAPPVSHSQSRPCALSDIGWMAGSWRNASDPDRAQERWSVAPNGILMGSAWEFPAGKSGYAERGAPMVFAASSCEPNGVIFDGQCDHAGEHMSYRRSGNKLTILADFLHHGTPDHEEWHMVLARD